MNPRLVEIKNVLASMLRRALAQVRRDLPPVHLRHPPVLGPPEGNRGAGVGAAGSGPLTAARPGRTLTPVR